MYLVSFYFNSASSSPESGPVASDDIQWLVNNELQGIWKETVLA